MKTKTTLVTVALLATLAGSAHAQSASSTPSAGVTKAASTTPAKPVEEDESNTLFGPTTRIGGYGGLETKMTSVRDTAAVIVGAQGGMLVGHTVVLGAAGYDLASPVDVPAVLRTPQASSRLSFGYGGARLGWILFPHAVIHAELAVVMGGGSVGWEENTGRYELDDGVLAPDMTSRSDAFFVAEPQLAVEANLHRHIRFAATGSYRAVVGVHAAGLPDRDLRGPALGAVLKFGAF